MEMTVNAAEMKDVSRARLIADVKAMVADAEDYLAASVGQTEEAYATTQLKLERTLDAAKGRIAESHRALAGKTRAVVRLTDEYAHTKPWASIAMGASAGLLLGLLLTRRAP